jgi:hypothetical protein
VLVVSNIDLTTDLPKMKPEAFLNAKVRDSILNLDNDYRYMRTGYYVSVHAEVLGNKVIPSSENTIEANRTPVLLLKASKAGIPTLPYIVTGSIKQIISEMGFPLVIFAVNPFSYDGYLIARNRSGLYRAVKSQSMNYKFAVCAQPLRGKMISVKSIFGECESEDRVKSTAERVYDIFKIPICRLHVQLVNDQAFLCGMQPLKREEILPQDLENLSRRVSEFSKFGDNALG